MGHIRSLVSLETLRDAIPAAAAAAAVLAITLYVAESYQIPYLPSQAIDATSSVLSPGGLSRLMSFVGELGKAFTFAGILALQFVIFVAAWLLAMRWRQPDDAGMTVRRALSCSAIVAAVFLVIAGFMAQFGMHANPYVTAAWRNHPIPDDPVTQSNLRGYLTFAATSLPNSRTTQVFINLVDNTNLDGMGFAPVGQVVEGMEVVDNLYSGYGEAAPTGSGPLQQNISARGNAYLTESFPELDYVEQATIVGG